MTEPHPGSWLLDPCPSPLRHNVPPQTRPRSPSLHLKFLPPVAGPAAGPSLLFLLSAPALTAFPFLRAPSSLPSTPSSLPFHSSSSFATTCPLFVHRLPNPHLAPWLCHARFLPPHDLPHDARLRTILVLPLRLRLLFRPLCVQRPVRKATVLLRGPSPPAAPRQGRGEPGPSARARAPRAQAAPPPHPQLAGRTHIPLWQRQRALQREPNEYVARAVHLHVPASAVARPRSRVFLFLPPADPPWTPAASASTGIRRRPQRVRPRFLDERAPCDVYARRLRRRRR